LFAHSIKKKSQAVRVFYLPLNTACTITDKFNVAIEGAVKPIHFGTESTASSTKYSIARRNTIGNSVERPWPSAIPSNNRIRSRRNKIINWWKADIIHVDTNGVDLGAVIL
jgi:hypothetical protein